MTTKHTPGPWRLDIAARSAGFAVVASRPKASGGTNRVCSTIPANRTPDAFEEAKANARLIAAAPEMLAALKDAIGALEFCRDDECVEVVPGHVRIRKVYLDANDRAKSRSRSRS